MIRLVAALIRLWPERLMVLIATVLGAVWFYGLRYRRGVILANLARAFPEKTEAERRHLGLRACQHLVRLLFEFVRIPKYQKLGYPGFVLRGKEHLDAALAKGKGVLALSGHLGSFELAVAAGAPLTCPNHLLVKRFPGQVDRFVTEIRSGAGLGVIPADGALRGIFQALKRNQVVVFVLDQNATRKLGVFVDFFGEPACTMTGLASLAQRTGAAVIPAIPWRAPDGTHVLELHPEVPFEPQADPEATLLHMTQRYTQIIEAAIRAHPEQWFWTHKRWRTRPISEKVAATKSEL